MSTEKTFTVVGTSIDPSGAKALLKEYTQLNSIQEFNYKEFFTNQDYVIKLLSCKT